MKYLSPGKCICTWLLVTLLLMTNLSVSIFAITAEPGTLAVGVSQLVQDETGVTVSISLDNQTNYTVSMGWENSCQLVVTTSAQEIYSVDIDSTSATAPVGVASLEVFVPDCMDEIATATLTDLCLLDETGALYLNVEDVTIYAQTQLDSFCLVDFATGNYQLTTAVEDDGTVDFWNHVTTMMDEVEVPTTEIVITPAVEEPEIPPVEAEEPAVTEEVVAPVEQVAEPSTNWLLWSIIGGGVLIALVVLLLVIRSVRRNKRFEQMYRQTYGGPGNSNQQRRPR